MRALQPPSRQDGFTLLEVLIAVVILSIGLLGVAGMQAVSLKNNHAAYTKTLATNLASDIAERIRANPLGHDYYAGFDSSGTIASPPSCISSSNGCTPEQLAKYDLYYWSKPIVDTSSPALPQGQATISRTADVFTVTLFWRERNLKGIAHQQCVTGQADDVACYELRFEP